MLRLPFEYQLLIVVQTVVLLALCLRMWRAGLHRKYLYFFTYLLLALVQTGVLIFVPYRAHVYAIAWMATEGPIACFYALIVLELYTIILRDLTGLASVSRRYIRFILVVAIVGSLLLLVFEKTPPSLAGQFIIFERTIAGSLLLFVLLITGFFVYYPVPLNRNVIAYSAGYAVYFLTKATALFIRNIGNHWERPISMLLIGVSIACLTYWLFTLSARGETKTVVIGHQWHPEDEERLLSQLRAINNSLARSARK